MTHPLLSLPQRTAIRHRNGVAVTTLRSWRAEDRKGGIRAFREEKRTKSSDVIAAAAGEIAAEAKAMLGDLSGWAVSCIACGHSRDPDCWGKMLARAVAAAAGAEFVQVFDDRLVPGSSHPKEFRRLPPLVMRGRPGRPLIVVDDLVTSGWHMEEALSLLRADGAPTAAMGIGWIGGSVADGRDEPVEPAPVAWGPSHELKWF